MLGDSEERQMGHFPDETVGPEGSEGFAEVRLIDSSDKLGPV